ncbi:hypothetical protein KA005_63395, partial [bacterium]|nr:hypothetical protein [bacterium]
MMEKFRDIYKGQTMWIVGKGPSLQYLTKEHIGSGPIITINQALLKIEEIGFQNPIYSMQKDGGNRRKYKFSHPIILKPDCDYKSDCGDICGDMIRPKQGATLLVHKHESLYCFADYSPRYVFDWAKLGLKCNRFSLVIAIRIGILMGCKKFCFISFDAHTTGSLDSYTPNVGITEANPAFRNYVWKVKRYLKNLDY